MGTDKDVVDAARVSFDNVSDWDHVIEDVLEPNTQEVIRQSRKVLKQSDAKLIKYLSDHNHWSPFSHAFIKVRVTAPIFVARQLAKHMVGFSWNEISRRYVSNPPEFYIPDNWRQKHESKKQGSYEDVFIDKITLNGSEVDLNESIKTYIESSCNLYDSMIASGVCPEQARMILPQNMQTSWIWSGSLYAFARMCNLRLKPDTQLETRKVAEKINDIIVDLFPVSWGVLIKK